MTFSLHQGGVVMSSQIKHTHSHQDTPLSPYTWQLSLDFQLLRPFYSLSQPHHATASLPSPCNNHQSMGGWSERTRKAKQKWPSERETHSVIYVSGLSTLSGLSRIVAQPPPSFLCCLRRPSHHPSSLTSVSLVPVSHWLRPSTPFWPYGTHPFFPCAETISILSDLLYSLTPFLFQLSNHLFIPNSIHSQHSNQTSQALHLKKFHFSSLSTSHTTCLCSVQRRWYNYSFV